MMATSTCEWLYSLIRTPNGADHWVQLDVSRSYPTAIGSDKLFELNRVYLRGSGLMLDEHGYHRDRP